MTTKVSKSQKIDVICEVMGMEYLELLEEAVYDGLAQAICMNPDCDYVTEMEPDQDKGWCDECKTNTMASITVLADII
jgi:hypothetical protein